MARGSHAARGIGAFRAMPGGGFARTPANRGVQVMMQMADVAAFTRRIVDDCNLHSASVFVCDRTGRHPQLKYLYHFGISQEVQDIYHRREVFHRDPFTDPRRHEAAATPAAEPLMLERAVRTDKLSADAAAYWSFMQHYEIKVIGASARRLMPGLYSTVGFHRKARTADAREVPLQQLDELAKQLQDMVCANMLQDMLSQSRSQDLLRERLYCRADARDPLQALSPREQVVAQFVRQGLLNKEVAFRTGLSEHTVENHLRRIYRKLGVPNRSSLAALMTSDRRPN